MSFLFGLVADSSSSSSELAGVGSWMAGVVSCLTAGVVVLPSRLTGVDDWGVCVLVLGNLGDKGVIIVDGLTEVIGVIGGRSESFLCDCCVGCLGVCLCCISCGFLFARSELGSAGFLGCGGLVALVSFSSRLIGLGCCCCCCCCSCGSLALDLISRCFSEVLLTELTDLLELFVDNVTVEAGRIFGLASWFRRVILQYFLVVVIGEVVVVLGLVLICGLLLLNAGC